ncbi:MAG TPA: BTAD domain-containing putative transcriptional regulator [Pseudonocardiaceae bacterium]
MTVEFRLLGPIEAKLDGTAVAIGPRQQAILALLLIEPHRLVTVDQILDRVWVGKRPARPANAVQTQLTLLRRALPGVDIAWQTGGYRIAVDEQTVDLHRFRALVESARGTTDAQRWTAAIALWRGEPFAGINLPWFTSTRAKLLAEYDAATLEEADALLRRGRHDELLPDLAARTAQRPLDERLAGQYMQALHGAGRTEEAVRRYDVLRERLADEFGADPRAPLRELRRRISGSASANVPRQLPPAPGSFTGRADELATMTKILDDATETGGTVIISAIAGTGGIGKTWLSLHWAHQHRERFPDGQLFIDLRGFSPDNQPVSTTAAVGAFLEALGVPPEQLPNGLDAQAALWRTLVADKRMLVVLDNAADTAQVLPLLPGSSTNTVLVNSRDRLTGLSTRYGAHRVLLDILGETDARALLRIRLGAERLDAEPGAVDELLACCGGFPLALSIVIGRALSHPDFPLAALAAELRDHRLHALDDDPATGLPSVLSWSYAALSPEQARAFGLLGIAPGADIGIAAAADLLDRTESETRVLLRALERASLLHQRLPARYGMHDLVRAYAREQAGGDAEPALRRIVDHYLHTACVGETTINQVRPTIDLAPPVAGAHPRAFDDGADAMRWLGEEYQNVSAAQGDAAIRGWYDPVWQFAYGLTSYQMRSGRLLDSIEMWRTGLAAAQRLGLGAEAIARVQLGSACARGQQFDEARSQLNAAVRIAADIGDLTTEAFGERYLFVADDMQGRVRDAESHSKRALALFEKVGNLFWVSSEMTNLGWLAANRGDFDYAKTLVERSLEIRGQQNLEDHAGDGNLVDCLGFIANGMGRYDEAIDYYQQARALYARSHDSYDDPETLEHLGHPLRSLGRIEETRAAWEAALRACREQQRATDAQRIEGLLAELSGVAVE